MSAPNFTFSSGVSIKEIKSVPGGTTDDPVFNSELKIVGPISNNALSSILGVANTEIKPFWLSDKDKSPKFSAVKNISLNSLHKNMFVTLGNLKFDGATIRAMSFSFTENEGAYLQMSVVILGVDDATSAALSHMTKTYDCEVSPMQRDIEDAA